MSIAADLFAVNPGSPRKLTPRWAEDGKPGKPRHELLVGVGRHAQRIRAQIGPMIGSQGMLVRPQYL